MSKKIKEPKIKSLKKSLRMKVEQTLSESLVEFPKKSSEKKYRKVLHKAGKIISRSLAVTPVKSTVNSKKPGKKNKTVLPKTSDVNS